MHHSRLCAILIDCRTANVDAAARFWGEALGRPVAAKPDSQDICFVPNGSYARVVARVRPGALEVGEIVHA